MIAEEAAKVLADRRAAAVVRPGDLVVGSKDTGVHDGDRRSRNRLLEGLPAAIRARVIAQCQTVDMEVGSVLAKSGVPIRNVHFPLSGFVTTTSTVDGSRVIETALVGDEGMLGFPLVLGTNIPGGDGYVQMGGTALRMSAGKFQSEMARSSAFRKRFGGYALVRFRQLAQAAACTRFHLMEGRLARWLLMATERAHANTLQVTHASLSATLGVRREGVTQAAGCLQKRHLVEYCRGDITILNRSALEAVACDCYRADRDTYDRVLGPQRAATEE